MFFWLRFMLCNRRISLYWVIYRPPIMNLRKTHDYIMGALMTGFHFTGFLRGAEVQKMFAMSDVYIMPSVSEPFGISPLEAMRSNVPAIISNQSGAAEVLKYAFKVDFWDVDAMADDIYALLKYPALADFAAREGYEEVNRLKWNIATAKLKNIYESVVNNK